MIHRPLVSVITVNFNQAEATGALLDSIRRQEYDAVEVIVVDNGSVDDPAPFFAAHYPEVILIRSETNLGFAGGNNLGLQHASGRYLFFVNNDAELTTGCISRLTDLFQSVPDLGIVSPLLCFPPEPNSGTVVQYAGMTRVAALTGRNRIIGEGEKDSGQFQWPVRTAYAHGAAMLVSRKVLEQAGPMSEAYFLYYEELDWCERIRRAGYSAWVEPRARVYHRESLTVNKTGALKTYFLHRNRVLFMRRNFRSLQLCVFYLFLLLLTVPKNVIKLWRRGETENLEAFLLGIRWNFFPWKPNRFENMCSTNSGVLTKNTPDMVHL